MPTTDGRTVRKLAWFVVLWAGGVLSVGSAALLLRLALRH
jgi:hypothetical protein